MTKYLKSKVAKTKEVLETFLFFVFLSEFSVGRNPSLISYIIDGDICKEADVLPRKGI